MTPEELAEALEDLDAESTEHLAHLLRDRADRIRREAPSAPAPVDLHVPVEAIWQWVLVDMVRSGFDRRFAAEIVASLALDVDRLSDAAVSEVLVAAFSELEEPA